MGTLYGRALGIASSPESVPKNTIGKTAQNRINCFVIIVRNQTSGTGRNKTPNTGQRTTDARYEKLKSSLSRYFIRHSGFGIPGSGLKIRDSGCRTRDSGFEVRASGFGTRARNSAFEIRHSKFGIESTYGLKSTKRK